MIYDRFCLFSETIFFPCSVSFFKVLVPPISDMTARWSEIPAAKKNELIELEMRWVIKRSSQ